MLNTRDSMREGMNERMNERTYTTTKHITTLLLRSRVKSEKAYFLKLQVQQFSDPIWARDFGVAYSTRYNQSSTILH